MAKRRTRTVSLTPDLDRKIARLVKSGRYGSASEVVRDAVRRLTDTDRRAELRAMIREGRAAARRGDVRTHEEVFAELDRLDEAEARPRRRRSA